MQSVGDTEHMSVTSIGIITVTYINSICSIINNHAIVSLFAGVDIIITYYTPKILWWLTEH